MNITGQVVSSDFDYFMAAGVTSSGAFTSINRYASHIAGTPWTGTRGVGFTFNAANTWTGETSYTGSSQAVSLLSPYLSVYMWKRIA